MSKHVAVIVRKKFGEFECDTLSCLALVLALVFCYTKNPYEVLIERLLMIK